MITGNRNDAQKKKKPAQREGYEGKTNRFNFVIFRNYDGSVTGKVIPRETYNRLTRDHANIP